VIVDHYRSIGCMDLVGQESIVQALAEEGAVDVESNEPLNLT
jgi:hypothetical protein